MFVILGISKKFKRMSGKTCSNCDQHKLYNKFYKRTNGNFHNQCIKCIQLKQKIAREFKKKIYSESKICTTCDITKLLKDFMWTDPNTFHTKCNTCVGNTEHICGSCHTVKSAECFWIRNDTNKPRGECKNCVMNRRDEWRSDNNEHYKAQAKEYRARPDVNTKNKKYQKEYYNLPENKQRKLALARENDRKRYQDNPNFKMKKILRARLTEMMKRQSTVKSDSTIKLLGCGVQAFKKWLEYQFTSYMTWENHGSYWHVDHIKPCASFNLTIEAEQKYCFHWSNMQPLTIKDNLEKSDTYNHDIKFRAELMLQSFKFIIRNI